MTHRWTDHDGTCCPVPRGTLIEAEYRNGERDSWIAMTRTVDHARGLGWYWAHPVYDDFGPLPYDILRYRIVKPRGLTILEAILAKVGEKETASAGDVCALPPAHFVSATPQAGEVPAVGAGHQFAQREVAKNTRSGRAQSLYSSHRRQKAFGVVPGLSDSSCAAGFNSSACLIPQSQSLSGGDKPEHLLPETAPGVQAASGGFSGVV